MSNTFPSDKTYLLHNMLALRRLDRMRSLLLDPEVDVDYEYEEKTPFMTAVSLGPDVVKLFLECERPIDYNYQGKFGISAFLKVARANNNGEVMRLLLDDPRIDVNQLDMRGWSAMRMVCASTEINALKVKLLLACERYAHAMTPCKDGLNPLYFAKGERWVSPNPEIIDLLQAHIKDPVTSRASLREELGGYPEHLAGELFAIVVLLCDDYLSPLAPAGAPSPLALLRRENNK